MDELIKIEERDGKRVVNARELHQFLCSKQDFSTWIKGRIEKYDFIENKDFVTAPQIYGTANGGHATRTEYIVTTDMAKELSMVENNERGRMARRYFIECEKIAIACRASYQIEDPIKRAEKWIEEEKERQKLQFENRQKEQLLIQQQPKVVFADAVTSSSETYSMKELATILAQRGVDIGLNRLYRYMRDNDYFGTRGYSFYNLPYQKYVEQGLFEIEINKDAYMNKSGKYMDTKTVLVTGKGLQYFINKFLNNKNK